MKKTSSDVSDHSVKQYQGWECEACTFKNYPKIITCQMCNTERTVISKENKIDTERDDKGFSCHACEFKLSSFVATCPNCSQILIPCDEQEDIKEEGYSKKIQTWQLDKPQKMVKCPSCEQYNDLTNSECVFCQYRIKDIQDSALIPIKKRVQKKTKIYSRSAYSTCRYCKIPIYGMTLEAHELGCNQLKGEQLQLKFVQIQKKYCAFCYQKFDSSQYDAHDRKCQARKQFYQKDSPTFKRCTKLQIDTMIYMHNKSQKLHWITEQSLIKRITSLGYKPSDLENLHHYIVNYAPIIIHMHVNSHMQFFVKDTHYRNQFQTKKSSGSLSQASRISWQDRMFDHLHHSASPFQRVKYGTINFTNDPKGVRACVGYGMSYFLLKSHIRNRCTVTDMDSSSPSATIATFQFCYNLLNKLPDAELRAAFEGSKANQIASNIIGSYKQIQIHGPIQFKEDIERVYVNKVELADAAHLALLKQFCKKNDLQYEIFQQEPVKVSPFGGMSAGLFAASPATFSFGSSPIFSPPIPTASTAHLFRPMRGRGRAYLRGSGLAFPPASSATQVEKQPQQGVDYI